MWNEIIDLEKALYYRLLNTGAVGPDTKTSRVQDLHYIQREWRHDKTAMSTPINRTSSRSRPRSRSRGEAEDERFVKDIVERGEWYIEKQLKDAGDSILEDVMERFKAPTSNLLALLAMPDPIPTRLYRRGLRMKLNTLRATESGNVCTTEYAAAPLRYRSSCHPIFQS